MTLDRFETWLNDGIYKSLWPIIEPESQKQIFPGSDSIWGQEKLKENMSTGSLASKNMNQKN